MRSAVFDPKEGLDHSEVQLGFLRSAFESDDEPAIADAARLVAEVRGMSVLAAWATGVRDQALREIGWDGESPREPQTLDFSRLKDLVEVLGYRLTPQAPEATPARAA